MEAHMSTEDLNEDTGQELESTVENEVEIELVDDTPESDRGRKPLDREVADPTDDELQQYSAGVKKRISELTHARHDERRKAEALAREREELERATRNLLAENQRLKQYVQTGEQEFMKVSSSAAEMELQTAKKQYKEAYESGDSDALLAAQEALTDAKFKLQQAKNFKPAPLQKEEEVVQTQHQVPDRVSVSDDTLRWQQRNQWFNDPEHPEMTAFALGVHKKLVSNGVDPRSKEYFDQIDGRMKKTFPEFFGEAETSSSGDGSKKPTTVVAPSTRSTGVKKVKLTTTQEQLARRLGITPQQYAVELAKMEKQNG
jgi:hypothetical protein